MPDVAESLCRFVGRRSPLGAVVFALNCDEGCNASLNRIASILYFSCNVSLKRIVEAFIFRGACHVKLDDVAIILCSPGGIGVLIRRTVTVIKEVDPSVDVVEFKSYLERSLK